MRSVPSRRVADCRVSVYANRDVDGNLVSAKITIDGKDARFPSVNERIPFRYITNEGRAAYGIKHTIGARDALDIITARFLEWCKQQRESYNFGDAHVQALVVMSENKGLRRWDHHNCIKDLADWMQKVRLIDDDKNLDILTLRLRDYESLQSSGVCSPTGTTIFISKFSHYFERLVLNFALHCDHEPRREDTLS